MTYPSFVARWPMRVLSLFVVTVLLPQTVIAQVAQQTPTQQDTQIQQQSSTQQAPTPEQLEILRNLTPEQQKALLEAVAESGGGTPRADTPLSMPKVTAPTTPQAGALGALRKRTAIDEVPRITAASTLLLDVTVDNEASPTQDPTLAPDVTQAEVLKSRRERILAANPYRLDGEGRLSLLYLRDIALAGLTALEAAQRLNADPRLSGLKFKVTLLPLEPMGIEALQPFGYSIFRETPTTFAPATDIPVPPDYVLGPGDTVIVELIGKRAGRYSLIVDREGRLHLPDFGPLRVAGLDFDSVRAEIERHVTAERIGVSASVVMGPLRSIRVFVLGDVAHPGSYTVSGLSTMTHALFVSGGVSEVGSLRNIELKRNGLTIGQLDLYELLLRGDSSNDKRLQSGDVVFVPSVGTTAGISGQVRRPAIYEFGSSASVADLIRLSGGLAPDADPRAAKLERIDSDHERTVLDIDLSSEAGRSRALRPGDVLIVPRVLDDFSRDVVLKGEVQRPGRYAWRQGMRITDLLGGLSSLKLNADQRYVLIRREHLPDRRLEVLSVDAEQAFAARGTHADPPLQSRDRVIVFSLEKERGSSLSEVVDELRLQARDNEPPPVVSISGRVRAPGQYPLESGMTVGDLVRAGGGLDEAAYRLVAELTRFDAHGGETRETEVVELQLAAILAGNAAKDIPLRAYDALVIKETPEWNEQGTMKILGEVRFPGEYPIRKGETLSSLVGRAGGLTDHAFIEGAVFTRDEIRRQERQQIESLVTRLQSNLSLVALQRAQLATPEKEGSAEALTIGQSLLAQLRETKPTGRLVIGLGRALESKGSSDDVELRNGDLLTVPPRRQYVTVIGEAQNPTSHVWRRGLGRDDYLSMSGGTTENADAKRIYVVRADGSVVARNGGNRWLSRAQTGIRPGDSIIVPMDTKKMRPLTLWTSVTTIIYNLAVAAAAVGSL